MKFSFESEIWEEEGQYVARANPFNVMTCARTKQEVQEALLEAVELFFETAQDMGTLEDILNLENGATICQAKGESSLLHQTWANETGCSPGAI
jgi:predicted RNase H-like HicB family nuclease